MHDFDHILHWTLKQGSHAFPGPDGGTCVNEAAVVAAGYPYQRVRRAEDMPACFSRPICRLAMQLNDDATDAERQFLIPYVTRLACADEPRIERMRETYIQDRIDRRTGFARGLEILDGALAIGRHADDLAETEVADRLESVRGQRRPAPAPRRTVASMMSEWLRGKKAPADA